MSEAEPLGHVDYQGLSPAALAQRSIADGRDLATRPPFPVVDAAVHPRPRPGELQPHLPAVWRNRRLPAGDRYYYPNPIGEYVRESYPESGPPGSDPELMSRHLFGDLGVAHAVLLPLSLGLLPDVGLQAAICSALNRWQADAWLARDSRYSGTIRVAPAAPEAAAAEIEKWAGDPRFVQVGMPMQSNQLYGSAFFLPVFEAAARHGRPVALHPDLETGVELPPTPIGYLRHHLGFAANQPLNFINHLTSLMTGGVFDHLPQLRIVCADGGHDMHAPFIWRLDKDYRPMRADMPWMKRLPSAYLRDHVRFVAHRLEGPEDPGEAGEWLEISDASGLLIYGSNYPHWNLFHPDQAFAGSEPGLRERILRGNATELYRLADGRAPAVPETGRAEGRR